MEAALPRLKNWRIWTAVLVGVLSLLRLAHVHLLWADEDYHLAAAIQILHGRIPYRDFWYDKPPLTALYYLLIGGYSGWPLRLLDAAYVLVACYFAYRLAATLWGELEGWLSALLLAFFTTFYLPSAIIPLAVDALMLVPHLAAIYCAARKRALWAGVCAGVAFWANPKAVFVLIICAVWVWPEWLLVVAGFAIPTLTGFLLAIGLGAWNGYIEQVWRWGFLYAKGSPELHPLKLALVRTADWLGFHLALALGVFFGVSKQASGHRWKLAVWMIVSFAAVCLGTRFAPHYFLQLLPAMVIVGSRGITLAVHQYRKLAVIALALMLLTPLIRFGPRYGMLAYDNLLGRDPHWIDVGMDLDSQDAARRVMALARPGDTLFVWGYRPDLYVYTRMIPPGLFWDSQPLTGVPADRHLHAENAIYSGPAASNREELIRTQPTFLIDGLSLLNPKLKPTIYPELLPWLADYQLKGKSNLCLIYQRR